MMLDSEQLHVKTDRQNKVDIGLFIIFDDKRSLWIHQIHGNLLIINNTQCIQDKLRIKSDHNILTVFLNIYLFILLCIRKAY